MFALDLVMILRFQGRNKRMDKVDNVQGPRESRGPLAVPCPWAPEGLATPVFFFHLTCSTAI